MKKKILMLITIVTFLASFCVNVYAVDKPTLEEIANKFNNNSTVLSYKEMGSNWSASVNGNKLIVDVKTNDYSQTVEYVLDGNILSSKIDGESESVFTGIVVTSIVVDSVGLFHGYLEGNLSSLFSSEELLNYTLENEGLVFTETSNGGYDFKLDITKKVPLIDFSDVYITVEDLKNLKEFISGDGSAESTSGNVWFNKSGYDGENTLLVAEKKELTENCYKSILSILEVMFDGTDAVNYFKENYPSISGDKEFKGFKIEVNPVKDEWEEDIISDDSGYKFLRISIDKNDVTFKINENSETKNLYNIIGITLLSAFVIGICLALYLVLRKKKQENY